MKSPCTPISGAFPVIPAQAGIQDLQTLAPCSCQGQALGPRFRGDDDVEWAAEFSYRLIHPSGAHQLFTGGRASEAVRKSSIDLDQRRASFEASLREAPQDEDVLNAIISLPHGEERFGEAEARLEPRTIALPLLFRGVTQFLAAFSAGATTREQS